MKHDDTTLQAAIDAAMIEIGNNHFRTDLNFIKDSTYWGAEPRSRLALAKAFLAKLPEPQPILADDGRSLGEVCSDAALAAGLNRATSKECDEAAAQAVASVVLAQAIRRMEAVPVNEMWKTFRRTYSMKEVRARLIAAARGEAEQQAEEAKSVPSTFEAHGKVWTRHTPGDPVPVDEVTKIDVLTYDDLVYSGQYVKLASTWNSVIGWRYADETDSTDLREALKIANESADEQMRYKREAEARAEKAEAALAESEKQFQVKITELLETLDRAEKAEKEVELLKKVPLRQKVQRLEREVNHWCDLHAVTYNRAEKAEAELAAIKSSPIGILRPLSEAGPVPDGCVRVKGYKCTENDWCLAHWENRRNTHFADIRLPSKETPAQDVTEVADPYARIKAYAKAGARIRLDGEYVRTDWTSDKKFPFWLSPEKYEVHPDDLHLVPEYAPVNEQPKQQVPLGPEDVMPGSVFRLVGADDESAWQQPHEILCSGAAFHNGGGTVMWKDWSYLASRFEINRSIPLTGKWDANAWEPCYKLI